ncbi:uncharacterized protein MCYG_01617 [Microsporum canis CBS 113480]|uniref:Uncharacterized protein n=1 Tax=Arthroderma otae (strain ATCC MYA-4605 / CBS 113480) TaxID=554155 RepID=C5FH79_ARTOC|nr:uncharacterized protein MCYG_01617 [Microsporum canis CBS 113480]EEQ28798.1 predicted protein [Microsporum canis CBS 113480]
MTYIEETSNQAARARIFAASADWVWGTAILKRGSALLRQAEMTTPKRILRILWMTVESRCLLSRGGGTGKPSSKTPFTSTEYKLTASLISSAAAFMVTLGDTLGSEMDLYGRDHIYVYVYRYRNAQ